MATRLDRLRALHAAATPGPWHTYEPSFSFGTESRIIGDGGVVCVCNAKRHPKPDSDSIAATHNAMPALLACVDALIAIRKQLDVKALTECPHDDKSECPFSEDHAMLSTIDAALAPLLEEQP